MGFLRKLKITSNGSRNVFSLAFKFKFYFFKKPIFFLKNKKSKSGRGKTGKIVCFTKKSFKSKPLPVINYLLTNRILAFLISFRFISYSNKLLGLVYDLTNTYMYLQTNKLLYFFDFIYFQMKNKKLMFFFPKPTYSFIFQLKNMNKISCLEILPGRGFQYARSSGVFGVLVKIDIKKHIALIKLPSGVKKFFSLYSMVMLDRNSLQQKIHLKNTKAGY